MRKIILSVMAAGTFIAGAAPAAAQYYGAPPPPPGPGYGYAYGHGNWGQVRALRMRIAAIRGRIERLDSRDAIGHHNADRLVHEANELDRRLQDRARGGLDPREAGDIEYRLQRLEQRVQWAMEGHWDRVQRDWGRDRY